MENLIEVWEKLTNARRRHAKLKKEIQKLRAIIIQHGEDPDNPLRIDREKRNEKIWELRNDGKDWVEIALRVNLSAARCKDIFSRIKLLKNQKGF